MLLVDPLSVLGASNNIDKAWAILKDGLHLKGCHMATGADKIKEVVAGWVRSRKRAGEALAGTEAKRAKLEVSAAGKQQKDRKKAGKSGKTGNSKSGQ